MAIHLGEEILKILDESGMPKTTFAERIGMNRSNVYDVFASPGCDTVRLRKISQVLRFNFFKLLSDDFEPAAQTTASEPSAPYGHGSPSSPMRIVIEVDQSDAAAKAEAERMAVRILEKSRPKPPAPKRKK